MLRIFWWNLIKCFVEFKGLNKIKHQNINYKSTLIKLSTILQVTIPFYKLTFLIEKLYFSVTSVWTQQNIWWYIAKKCLTLKVCFTQNHGKTFLKKLYNDIKPNPSIFIKNI